MNNIIKNTIHKYFLNESIDFDDEYEDDNIIGDELNKEMLFNTYTDISDLTLKFESYYKNHKTFKTRVLKSEKKPGVYYIYNIGNQDKAIDYRIKLFYEAGLPCYETSIIFAGEISTSIMSMQCMDELQPLLNKTCKFIIVINLYAAKVYDLLINYFNKPPYRFEDTGSKFFKSSTQIKVSLKDFYSNYSCQVSKYDNPAVQKPYLYTSLNDSQSLMFGDTLRKQTPLLNIYADGDTNINTGFILIGGYKTIQIDFFKLIEYLISLL